MKTISDGLSKAFNRYLPESLVIAVGLTFFTLALAIFVEGVNPTEVVKMWGDSFWSLLAFSMQIAMLLLTGYMLANTPIIDRGLTALSSRISNPRVAVASITATGLMASWINAGMGLVIGVILARKIARSVTGLHYPLAVAGAYSGFSLYGIGLSGTVPLAIATPGHFLEEQMGIIPISETVFHPIVLATSIAVLVALPLFVAFLHPKPGRDVEPAEAGSLVDEAYMEEEKDEAPVDKLNRSKFVGIAMGLLGVVYSVVYFVGGGGVDFNIINLVFLSLGLLLFANPLRYLRALGNGIHVVGGVLVQYPMYAGIMGVLTGSGLMVTFAGWFVSVSNAQTLPFFAFLSAGVINILAPSGGGQWAVQGPVMIEAANQLGADFAATSIAVQIGDQWTNMIQPFWILPVLAISGIKLRSIMGYMFLILVFLGVIFGSAVLLWGFFG